MRNRGGGASGLQGDGNPLCHTHFSATFRKSPFTSFLRTNIKFKPSSHPAHEQVVSA